MRTITDTVRSLMEEDEIAREAARRGILNSSAYSREILDQVEEETWKDVEESSVTVAVNRISQEDNWGPIRPDLLLDRISVETGLVDVTFERTSELRELLTAFLPPLRQQFHQDLFIETSGQHQVTMVMSNRMWQEFQRQIDQEPLGIFENQVAISISFDESFLPVPNFIYSVLGIFALDNINIIEIFSTMTEITIVINNEDLDLALSRVKNFMK
jgi:hypothetical protein